MNHKDRVNINKLLDDLIRLEDAPTSALDMADKRKIIWCIRQDVLSILDHSAPIQTLRLVKSIGGERE